ncbi:hypothetical protein GMB86_01730 [Terrilactibacillus sp. BCM23-1]|uniref:VOC domain-containing protein n=1 Tax=Terrilactibacillus tamarindi TaxID=2599694 RepID=A0A6N8CNP9_9BACI|nr:hypothetical protein [Terrilactibacillus tamarindi]MTT30733.1 hypothetical protein [Terrilactibacillus tamarindi]
MLFHYHFWTPFVEETEAFYKANGFRVFQRIGRYHGNFQTFNPPQNWDEFRNKTIIFRIIEMKKGSINITFGYGKKVMFDHIGFLVSDNDNQKIINKARKMNLNVQVNERRTFIGTPFGFRIELQTHKDAVESVNSPTKINKLEIATKSSNLSQFLMNLFEVDIPQIISTVGNKTTITRATFSHIELKKSLDPNGVTLQIE